MLQMAHRSTASKQAIAQELVEETHAKIRNSMQHNPIILYRPGGTNRIICKLYDEFVGSKLGTKIVFRSFAESEHKKVVKRFTM